MNNSPAASLRRGIFMKYAYQFYSARLQVCHSEERSDVGISWYSVIVAFYQEIATPYGLAMTNSEACCVKPTSILDIRY